MQTLEASIFFSVNWDAPLLVTAMAFLKTNRAVSKAAVYSRPPSPDEIHAQMEELAIEAAPAFADLLKVKPDLFSTINGKGAGEMQFKFELGEVENA